jgi:hypothetical protein
MHELGHNLGLLHGGNQVIGTDDVNCKPNYLSVMNYLFQFKSNVPSRPLDFSRSTLATLNENALNEPNGVSQSEPPRLNTTYGPVRPAVGSDRPVGPGLNSTGIPLDWNFNKIYTDTNVISDVNSGLGGCDGNGQTLNGFDDWENIVFRTNPSALPSAVMQQQGMTPLQVEEEDLPIEQTIDDIRESRQALLIGIDNAILRITWPAPPPQPFDTSHIAELLQSDQLEEAIVELDELKAQVIAVYGEELAKEAIIHIENLIEVLELQIFGETPPTPPTPPPASDCVGTGSGNSIITGTPGPDTLIGTNGVNSISGLGGNDRINGCAGSDRIDGNADNDGIAGGPGNDVLNGNAGNDLIQGDEGNDQLSGGAGINTLTGGPGRDSFICSPNSETTITDFEQGVDRMSGPCLIETEVSTATLTTNTSETTPETQREEGLTEIQEEEASETARDTAIERYISSSAAAGRQ